MKENAIGEVPGWWWLRTTRRRGEEEGTAGDQVRFAGGDSGTGQWT